MKPWSVEKSTELYGVKYWGKDYFQINSKGNVNITPQGSQGPQLDLKEIADDLLERGVRLPILIRFPDIIKTRIELLANCFKKAIQDCGYKGNYQGVYPIKVNQQRHVVEEIIGYGKEHSLGLECGSKPELLIAIALLNTPEAYIICNGFKDEEYIETALLSQKLGKKTFIVIDRFAELSMVLNISKRLNIKPLIGLRTKLQSKSLGRWVESTGEKSKFGLSSSEVLKCVEILKSENRLDCLELVHYHIGSQIPSIHAIKQTLKEASRFYSELFSLGATPKYLDVGGGLGVDYDGSGKGDSSTNYDEQEYANDVIFTIQSICDEKKVPHPHIISESGRALVAHSSLLIFDILGSNLISSTEVQFEVTSEDSRLVKDLFAIYQQTSGDKALTSSQLNELYNDLVEKRRDTLQLFSYGVLNLKQRAKSDDLYWASCRCLFEKCQQSEDTEDIGQKLKGELIDIYYGNFSVFQSLPDSWALGQHFPLMPLQKLKEQPCRRATIVDLTCDSDGKLNKFIDHQTGLPQSYLNVHKLNPNEPYYMGIFLTGAYQEILGDLHNLFGDTDAVHIEMRENGNYKIKHLVEGDTVSEVLSSLEYFKGELQEKIRETCEIEISEGRISKKEANNIFRFYESGLNGYTYLE